VNTRAVQAFSQAMRRTITSISVPKGTWLEFDDELRGYQVPELRINFENGARLKAWPDVLLSAQSEPLADEIFILEVLFSNAADVAHTDEWQDAHPLTSLLKGKAFVDQQWIPVEYEVGDSEVPYAGVRLTTEHGHLQLLTESPLVLPLSLGVTGSVIPVYRQRATGEREAIRSTWPRKRKSKGT
jgi:hypothetical protein